MGIDVKLCGWVNRPYIYKQIAAKQPHPLFASSARGIKNTGKGRDVFLWQYEEKVTGKDVRLPHNQTIGDCVSHGTAGSCEDLEYIQIYHDKLDASSWKWVATEVIYAGCRHEIGNDALGHCDGAIVGWAIDWGLKYGILPRGVYGSVDLSEYDGERARKWGAPKHGCPDELEGTVKKYPLLRASLIEGPDYYEQAIDALANEALIVSGSEQLFSEKRDKYGFITPSDSPGGHCTYYRGFTDNPVRPGIFYQNSWSEAFHIGPQIIELPGRNKQLKIPFGGGFVEAEVFNKMHKGQEMWTVTRMTDYAPTQTASPLYLS